MTVANPLPGIPLVESPLFASLVDTIGLSDEERRIATDLNERGFAIIDFPDSQIHQRVDRIRRRFAPRFGLNPEEPLIRHSTDGARRVQDAWLEDEDVKAIAANPQVLLLLQRLYGRPAIPFQTLNFPVATEQNLHSDANHFSSIPERFMCGVWLAMEDVHPDAGALTYAPGSHKWPIVSNLMIGRRGSGVQTRSAQDPFEGAWNAMLKASGGRQETFAARQGQALIWSANLLHGGSPQIDPKRTRWSQVTHYYFEDCIYYTPAHSDEAIGEFALRSIRNIATGEAQPNRFLGRDLDPPRVEQESKGTGKRWFGLVARKPKSAPVPQTPLPEDFDAVLYLQLNPDVAAAGQDPADHYLRFGRAERRAYRSG